MDAKVSNSYYLSFK